VPPAFITGLTVGVIVLMVIATAVAIAIAYLVFWFYNGDDTRQTLEYFDARTRWTDGRPAPVIGMVIVCAGLAAWTPISLVQQILLYTGLGGSGRLLISGLVLAATGVMALLAIRPIYRMPARGGGLALALALLGSAGTIGTILFGDPAAVMTMWTLTEEEMQPVRDAMRTQQRWQTASVIAMLIFALGFLIWARKFFREAQAPIASPTLIAPP
jgi:hypothetical protein